MLLQMGLAQFAVATLILITAAGIWLRRRQPSALLFAALAVYGAAGLLSAKTLTEEFGAAAYARAGAVFLCGAVVLVMCMDLSARALKLSAGGCPGLTWGSRTLERHAKNGLLFAAAGLLLIIIDRSSLSEPWNTARLTSGRLTALAVFLLLMGVPACITVFQTRRRSRWLLLLPMCAIAFLLTGSRAVVMSSVLLGIWMLLQRTRSPVGQAALAAAAIPAAFAGHLLLRFFRGMGPGGTLDALRTGTLVPEVSRYAQLADSSGGEMAISRYFVYATAVSSEAAFGFLTTFKRLITMAVPSVPGIFEKPTDVTYRLWERAFNDGLFTDDDGLAFLRASYSEGVLGSVHATLFGELFLAGGWFSLLVSLAFVSFVVTWIDWCLMRADPLLGLTLIGPVLAGYLFIARGNTVVGVGYFVYLFVLFKLWGWLTGLARGPARTTDRVAV